MLQAATATARPLASGRGATTMPAAQAAVRRGVHALRPALPLTPPPIARRPHPSPRRLSTARVSAFLSSDGGASVGSLLTSAAVAVSVSAGLVALYNDSAALGARRRRSGRGGGALPPPAEKQLLPAASDDNLRWAVMGVVSCLPLFNWMAWLFGAFDGGPRVYYLYAILYSLPLLQHGLSSEVFSDPMAVLLLVLGACHCQLERVAATEPEERAALAAQLSPPALVSAAARAAAAALRAADGVDAWEEEKGTEEPKGALPPGRPRWGVLFGGGKSNEEEDDDDGSKDPVDPLLEADRREAKRVARMEMEAFDRQLAKRAGGSSSSGSDEGNDGGEAAAAAAAAAGGRAAPQQQPYPAPPPSSPPRRERQLADDDATGGW